MADQTYPQMHVKRIYRTTSGGTTDKNTWIDVLRVDDFRTKTPWSPDQGAYQGVVWHLKWLDGYFSTDPQPPQENQNPIRQTHTLTIYDPSGGPMVPPPSSGAPNTVDLWLNDHVTTIANGYWSGRQGEGAKRLFKNYTVETDPGDSPQKVTTARKVHAIRVVNNDLGGLDMTAGPVDWATYLPALQGGAQDDSQYVDVEVVGLYKTFQNSGYPAWGGLDPPATPGTPPQTARTAYFGGNLTRKAFGADTLDTLASVFSQSPSDADPVFRTDPYQVIVNVNFGGGHGAPTCNEFPVLMTVGVRLEGNTLVTFGGDVSAIDQGMANITGGTWSGLPKSAQLTTPPGDHWTLVSSSASVSEPIITMVVQLNDSGGSPIGSPQSFDFHFIASVFSSPSGYDAVGGGSNPWPANDGRGFQLAGGPFGPLTTTSDSVEGQATSIAGRCDVGGFYAFYVCVGWSAPPDPEGGWGHCCIVSGGSGPPGYTLVTHNHDGTETWCQHGFAAYQLALVDIQGPPGIAPDMNRTWEPPWAEYIGGVYNLQTGPPPSVSDPETCPYFCDFGTDAPTALYDVGPPPGGCLPRESVLASPLWTIETFGPGGLPCVGGTGTGRPDYETIFTYNG